MEYERHTGPNPIEDDTEFGEAVVRVELKARTTTITSRATSIEDMDRLRDAMTDALEALGWVVDVRCSEVEYT